MGVCRSLFGDAVTVVHDAVDADMQVRQYRTAILRRRHLELMLECR
jgi:hypothetical protein